MRDKLWHLQSCNLFGQLSSGQIGRLESRSRSRSFAAGSPIYLPAETANSVFLVTNGLVKTCQLTSDGKESILAFIEPGELFGELAIFDEKQRDEYVEAVERSTVVAIPADELQRLIAECPDFALSITKMVGLRRHRIECRLKNLLFLSNRDRLVHLLLDLAEQFGSFSDDGIRIRIKLSHQDLANLIGSTRETVTVILGQLRRERSVAGGRRQIILTAPQRLAHGVHRQPPSPRSPTLRLAPSLVGA